MFTAETMNINGHDSQGLAHRFSVISCNVSEFIAQLMENHKNKLNGEVEHEVEPRTLAMWPSSHHSLQFEFHACFNILRVLIKYDPYIALGIPPPAEN